MPTKWMKRFREDGQLTVCNKAGAWTSNVNAAINTFNNLGFGLKLVAEKNELEANIIVKLSSGPSDSFSRYDDKITVNFPVDQMHGKAVTLAHPRLKEIYLAAIFLPGLVKATPRQREVIIVHEFLHASGLDGGMGDGKQHPNMDHDDVGIMVGQMKVDGDGLLEYFPEQGAKTMTPIRVGAQTMCKMRMLWQGQDCKHN